LILRRKLNRRTEFTLFGLVFVALLAAGVLIWGQQTGRMKIFGDALITSGDEAPLALSSQAVSSSTYQESFDSLDAYDSATTADWNIEAGEVTLPYGGTMGIARSGAVSDVTGEKVWVQLSTEEDRPSGSAIYYAVSADGGTTWQTISSARPAVLASPAGQWQWRALLLRGVASRPPAILDLELTFFRQP
jgi:hypothetical protein